MRKNSNKCDMLTFISKCMQCMHFIRSLLLRLHFLFFLRNTLVSILILSRSTSLKDFSLSNSTYVHCIAHSIIRLLTLSFTCSRFFIHIDTYKKKNVESATSQHTSHKNQEVNGGIERNEQLKQLPDAIDVYIVCNLDFYKRHIYACVFHFVYGCVVCCFSMSE